MRTAKEVLKALLDKINQALTTLDGVLPSDLKPYLLGPLREIRQYLQAFYDWILNGGDADELAQAATIWQAYSATITQLAINDITRANLNALAAPTRWTDPNAPDHYTESFGVLPNAFDTLTDSVQAIATGLNADADKINQYYDGMNQGLLALYGDLMGTIGAALSLDIVGAIGGVFYLGSDVSQILSLRGMQAPIISPSAEGQSWPTPVLW